MSGIDDLPFWPAAAAPPAQAVPQEAVAPVAWTPVWKCDGSDVDGDPIRLEASWGDFTARATKSRTDGLWSGHVNYGSGRLGFSSEEAVKAWLDGEIRKRVAGELYRANSALALYSAPPANAAGVGIGPHLAAEVAGCSHEWVSRRSKCECQKCKALMIDGSAYYPADKIGDVVEAALQASTGGAETGWRDISTAPHDDKDILVGGWLEDAREAENGWHVVISSYEDKPYRRGFRHRNGANWARLWMPMPPTVARPDSGEIS